MTEAQQIRTALAQISHDQLEYEPGYWVWQMETEVRDTIYVAALCFAMELEATAR